MFSSASLSCVLILLSVLILAAWSAGNPEMKLQPEERGTDDDIEQETNSNDEEAQDESGDDILRIEKVVKQILSKSVDAKTIILAKDSTFNFFPRKLKAEIHVSEDSEAAATATAKDNGVGSSEHRPTEDSLATDDETSAAVDGLDDYSTEQLRNDVGETPTPGSEANSLDIASQSEATDGLNTCNASKSETISQNSSVEETTKDIPNKGQIQKVDPNRNEKATSSEGTETNVSDAEWVSGRIKESKYVYIRSLVPVKKAEAGVPKYVVLDVDFEHSPVEDESRRIVVNYNDQGLGEQWQIDNQTNTIRNRLKNLCIDFNERHHLIANPCSETRNRQTWLYDHIRRTLYNPHYNYVADVVTSEAEVGGNVKVEFYDGRLSQQFALGTLPLYFALENEKTGLALSVLEDRDRPGTKLVLGRLARPPTDGQLWYLDSKKVLRSKLNDYVIDGSSGIFLAEPFSFEAIYTTSWSYFDRQIINLNDERMVMEPASNDTAEELVLGPTRRHEDRIEQKFRIVYTSPNDTVIPENVVTSLPMSKGENTETPAKLET